MKNTMTLSNGISIDLNEIEYIDKIFQDNNFNGLFFNKRYLYYYIMMKSRNSIRVTSPYIVRSQDVYKNNENFLVEYNNLVSKWSES